MSKVAWKFYAARRGYDLYELIYGGYFKSYEQYCTWCDGRDVEPLTKDEYATYVAEVEKTKPKPAKPAAKKPVAAKKPAAKPKAAPARARRVVAKDED